MFGLVIAVLISFLGAAVVGSVVAGLFWLTLLAGAGMLLVGAMGVALVGARLTLSDAFADWRSGMSPVPSLRGTAPDHRVAKRW